MENISKRDQVILTKHGLQPKHQYFQQAFLVSGSTGEPSLHDELENGNITVKHGINRFTQKGVIFSDAPNEEVPIDAVIFGTEFMYSCDIIDKKVADLSFYIKNNSLILYKSMLPNSQYDRIAFINYFQSIVFIAGELQSRVFCRLMNNKIALPSLKERMQDTMDENKSIRLQFLDRKQYKVTLGFFHWDIYHQYAKLLGCYPSFWQLLIKKPLSLWSVLFHHRLNLNFHLVGYGKLTQTGKIIK